MAYGKILTGLLDHFLDRFFGQFFFCSQYSVGREWPSGQSAGLWVGRPGFKSWMGHYVVALSKSLHSPCFVFSDKT